MLSPYLLSFRQSRVCTIQSDNKQVFIWVNSCTSRWFGPKCSISSLMARSTVTRVSWISPLKLKDRNTHLNWSFALQSTEKITESFTNVRTYQSGCHEWGGPHLHAHCWLGQTCLTNHDILLVKMASDSHIPTNHEGWARAVMASKSHQIAL